MGSDLNTYRVFLKDADEAVEGMLSVLADVPFVEIILDIFNAVGFPDSQGRGNAVKLPAANCRHCWRVLK